MYTIWIKIESITTESRANMFFANSLLSPTALFHIAASIPTTSGTKNPPANFGFNGKDNSGKLLAEGEYRTKITARYLNGYEPAAVYSPVFVLDNQAPAAKVSLPSNTVFNGKSNFEISQENVPEPSFTGEKTWTGTIVDSKNNVVRQFNFDSNLPPKASWNGLDDNGKFVADGAYRYVLNVTEPAGNSASFETLLIPKLEPSETGFIIKG